MVRQIARHGGVPTGGAKKPFPVGSGLHEFEITILDAVGTADGAAAIALDSFHFEDESVTFFVDRKATIVDSGRIGSEWFGADRAAGKFGVHHYFRVFPAPPEAKAKLVSSQECWFVCPLANKWFVFFPVEAAE
ncbi:MAG: hypothetical protein WBV55_09335 [Candidatus Sulfotelmatobacter sp.]